MVSAATVASDNSVYIHVNSSSRVQVVRLLNELGAISETLAFPGERFLFEITKDTELEIVCHDSEGLTTERISNLA